MKLTILGNCGPYPGINGGTSGYLVSAGETHILTDCGSGTVSRLWSVLDPARLSGVILTHDHWDHVSDFMMLATTFQFAAMKGQLPEDFRIPVYLQKEPGSMTELLTHCPAADRFNFIFVNPGDRFTIGSVELLFTPARHPLPCVGVRFTAEGRTLYYTGDTNVLDSLAQSAKGADAILTDSGLLHQDWSENAPHLDGGESGKLAAAAGVPKLYLTHLPPYGDASVILKEALVYCPGAELTEIGAVYGI